MKKIISILMIISLILNLAACSGNEKLIKGSPEQGVSIVVYMNNGKILEGLSIKDDESTLIYIDNVSHKAEKLQKTDISRIQRSNTVYDFDGIPISKNEIKESKGIGKTLGYGAGGFVLGTAVGFGIGIILLSAGSIAPIYPMLACGLGGGYYFGLEGDESETEDAIKEIRDNRFEKSKEKLEKELKDTQNLIEQKELEKEKLLKEIEQKKNEKNVKKDS